MQLDALSLSLSLLLTALTAPGSPGCATDVLPLEAVAISGLQFCQELPRTADSFSILNKMRFQVQTLKSPQRCFCDPSRLKAFDRFSSAVKGGNVRLQCVPDEHSLSTPVNKMIQMSLKCKRKVPLGLPFRLKNI